MAKGVILTVIFQILFSFSGIGYCLQPTEVLVVANKRMSGSEKLAKYYMKVRGIPEKHLLQLSLSLEEVIHRDDFEDDLREPIVQKLAELEKRNERIAAIVLMHGVPLKVLPPEISWEDKEKLREILLKIVALNDDTSLSDEEITRRRTSLKNVASRLERLQARAAVDSELFLVKVADYELEGWIRNPYFLGFANETTQFAKDDIILVSRLDAPQKETVYRLIDDSIAVEKTGLQGVGYFDARWTPPREEPAASGYERYDLSIHRAAEVVGKRMEVVLDSQNGLFPKNGCPRAALYCGWYSLGQYIDSFDWQPGAVGYHLASAECATLRNTDRALWCPSMLEQGVAATIGPVYEPYVQGFPLPELFFSYLTEGYMSLGEAYLVSLPYISWQTILVGDPLYQPFLPASSQP